MEKKDNEILEQLRKELSELKERVEELDARLSSYGEGNSDPAAPAAPDVWASDASVSDTVPTAEEALAGDFGIEPIDIMLDDEITFVVPNRKEEMAASVGSVLLGKENADEEDSAEESVFDQVPEKASSPKPVASAPKQSAKGSAAPAKDSSAAPDKIYAWHTANPASPLSNIASGIAMRDRGIFINHLFKENPQLFIETINALNGMGSLAEAERYLAIKFPEWNMAGDVVYRFMMAVRRKLA